MSKQQIKLFEPTDQHPDTPGHAAGLSSPPALQTGAASRAGVDAWTVLKRVAMVCGFAYLALGELFLPDEWRFSSLLGDRMGNLEARRVETGTPAQVRLQEQQTIATAGVQLEQQARQMHLQIHGTCVQDRNAKARDAFDSCMRDLSDAVLLVCEMKAEQVLASIECPEVESDFADLRPRARHDYTPPVQ